VWDLASDPPKVDTLVVIEDGVVAVAFRPGRHQLVTSDADGQIVLWDVVSQQFLRGQFMRQQSLVYALGFDRTGDILFGGGDAGLLAWQLADSSAPRPLGPLKGHSVGVSSLALTPDGQRMISGDWDGAVLLWDRNPFPSGTRLLRTRESVGAIAFSPDGRRLATRSDDSISIWDLEHGVIQQVLPTDASLGGGIAFSRDGQSIVFSRHDSIRVLRVAPPARTHKAAPDTGGAGGSPTNHSRAAIAPPMPTRLDFDATELDGGVDLLRVV
jgi:WD40 repeat protein